MLVTFSQQCHSLRTHDGRLPHACQHNPPATTSAEAVRLRPRPRRAPPPPLSQQPACSQLRLIQLNAEKPRRLTWPSRSFIPPLSLSINSLQPTFQLLQYVLPFPLDSALITPCLPLPLCVRRTPLSFAPRATSAPRRLSFDPSTHSRSASTTTLSWRTSISQSYPDTNLLVDGHQYCNT